MLIIVYPNCNHMLLRHIYPTSQMCYAIDYRIMNHQQCHCIHCLAYKLIGIRMVGIYKARAAPCGATPHPFAEAIRGAD